jgi:hypothetical protein
MFFAILLILFAAFAYPKLSATVRSNKALKSASQKLNNADIAGGLSEMQFAIDTIKSQGAMSAQTAGAIEAQLTNAAASYPLESYKILEFIQTNGIELNCNDRASMYHFMLEQSYAYAKERNLDGVRQTLFLGPYWSGNCPVDAKELKNYKRIFDALKKEEGAYFVEADWMANAYAGNPVAQSPDAALAKPAPAAPPETAVKGMFAKAVNKVEIQFGLIKEKATSLPGAQPVMPAPQPATDIHPVAKPGNPALIAPSDIPQTKTTANPVAPAPATATAAVQPIPPAPGAAASIPVAPQPAVKQGFLQKVQAVTDLIARKIAGIFGKGKNEQPAAKPAAAPAPRKIDATVLAREIERTKAELFAAITARNIQIESTDFSPDGTLVTIVFSSPNIGNAGLVQELKSIFIEVDGHISQTNIIPLELMSIQLKDGKGLLRAKWAVSFADYKLYRDKKMDGATFKSRWGEKTFLQ